MRKAIVKFESTMYVNSAFIANQYLERTEFTIRNVLLTEDATILHRFNRTNLERANQRYWDYDLWDL